MSIQYRSPSAFLSFPFLLFVFAFPSQYCSATDTLTQSQQVSVGQTLISSSQIVELGFFSPGNSSKQYVGIWYKNIPLSACEVVWVANRENPLTATDSASSLTIGKDGNLRLLDGMRNTVWWTNVSFHSNNSIAVLSDKGDFILRDNVLGLTIWESFTYPCDTFLPGMMTGLNTKTGEKRFLSSWLTEDDPSPGKFVCGFTPDAPQQAFIWNGSQPYWRGGPWDGWKFIGVRDTNMGYADGFNLLPDNQLGSAYLALVTYNASYFKIMVLTPAGSLEIMEWNEEMKNPNASCVAPANPRDICGVCGPFGACNKDGSPICECLKGFVPESTEDWKKGNWTGGCVRQTELLCQKNVSSLASGKAKNDGFWNMSKVKLPDHFQYLYDKNYSECQQWCLSNCSCVAYAYVSGIGCMVWAGGLIDIQQSSFAGSNLFLRLSYSELHMNNEKLFISFITISGVVLVCAFMCGLYWYRVYQREKRKNGMDFAMDDIMDTLRDSLQENVQSSELPMIGFDKILVATDNFSKINKIGEGGFGPVHKGKLEDGQEVAVKRLSRH